MMLYSIAGRTYATRMTYVRLSVCNVGEL